MPSYEGPFAPTQYPGIAADKDGETTWIGGVLDKGGAVYNVRHPTFGAIGDGIADDAAAIQAAINALPARGGTVFFPGGDYRCAAQIVLPTGRMVRLAGDGYGMPGQFNGGSRIVSATATALFLGQGSGVGTSRVLLGCSNLQFDAEAGSGSCFRLGTAGTFDLLPRSYFDHCSFNGFDDWAINTRGEPNIYFYHCDFRDNEGHVYLDRAGEVRFVACRFSQLGGADLTRAWVFGERMNKLAFTVCMFFQDADHHGIHLRDCQQPSVRDCTFEISTAGVYNRHYVFHEYTALACFSPEISGNKMTRSNQTGGTGRFVRLENCRGGEIHGNSFTYPVGNTDPCITLAQIAGNVVRDMNIGRNYWETGNSPLVEFVGDVDGITFDGIAPRIALTFHRDNLAAGVAVNLFAGGESNFAEVARRAYVVALSVRTSIAVPAGEQLDVNVRLPGGGAGPSVTVLAGAQTAETVVLPDHTTRSGNGEWGVQATSSNNAGWDATLDVVATLELLVFEHLTNTVLAD